MSKTGGDREGLQPTTRLVSAGRDKSLTGPFVNTPVVHASTVLFDTVDDMLAHKGKYHYGRRGTPTMEALETAVSELEGAAGTVLCPSGLSAASTAILSAVDAGQRILLADCVYGPTRHFADTILRRFGVEPVYFDPGITPEAIPALFDERTRAVYLEVPGSLTFEMQDIPAFVAAARARNVTVIMDNTWATPLYFKPLAHGVDLSVQSGTKYFSGHSDVMIGTVAASAAAWPRLKETHGTLGLCAGPDDINLTLRGIRTLAVRLERQMRSALEVAAWLAARPEVGHVLHPGLPGDPGHALWLRDMKGASGLFSFTLRDQTEEQAKGFIDRLALFGIGASWGGYESLVTLAFPPLGRATARWRPDGPLIRLHIGLEDPADLIADLEASFTAARA